MKAISLTQPWASLVAIGAKRIETRSWSTSYRGPIAIHASKGFPGWAKDTCFEEPFYSTLRSAKLISEALFKQHALVPLGAIVAVASLVTVARTEEIIDLAHHTKNKPGLLPHEFEFGDYSPRRFGWLLRDVRQLREPIPCKGALGLWDVPPEIARQLETV